MAFFARKKSAGDQKRESIEMCGHGMECQVKSMQVHKM